MKFLSYAGLLSSFIGLILLCYGIFTDIVNAFNAGTLDFTLFSPFFFFLGALLIGIWLILS